VWGVLGRSWSIARTARKNGPLVHAKVSVITHVIRSNPSRCPREAVAESRRWLVQRKPIGPLIRAFEAATDPPG
jgi:hypothetical protein